MKIKAKYTFFPYCIKGFIYDVVTDEQIILKFGGMKPVDGETWFIGDNGEANFLYASEFEVVEE